MLKTTQSPSGLAAGLICAFALATAASAETADSATAGKPSVDELVKLKQNPVSGLRQVIFQADVSPDLPASGKTEGTYSLQAVWPFSLGQDWRLVTYTILPVIQMPLGNGQSTAVGLGDALLNFYVTPKKPGALVWGAGPAVLLPTRSNPDLGSDCLGIGPSALLYYAKDAWGAGVVLQNVWSLGGSGVNKVNELSAQYFLNYNLPHGWFLYSNATVTADWTAADGDRWTVPVGGGAGKVFNIGKQSVSASLQGLSNVVTPPGGAKWSVVFQFSLLFP